MGGADVGGASGAAGAYAGAAGSGDCLCEEGAVVECITTCGSTGSAACRSCIPGSACAPPVETCDGSDQDCDGTIDNGLSAGGTEITLTGDRSVRPSVVATSFGFAVAYLDMLTSGGWRVALARYDQTGVRLGAVIDVTTTLGGPPAVAWNGSTIAVVWAENYNGSGIYFRSFTSDGTPKAPSVSLAPTNPQATPVIYPSKAGFVVAYTDYRPTLASRLATTYVDELGAALGAEADISTSTARVYSLAGVFGATGGALYYSDTRSNLARVYRRMLDGVGNAVGSETPIIDGTVWGATDTPSGHALTINSFQTDPVNSAALTRDLLVRVDVGGTVVNQSDLAVPQGTVSLRSYPAAAWFGGRLLVVSGLTLEVRDTELAKISGPFPFAEDVPGGGYYVSMTAGSSRVAASVGFDGKGGMAKLRFFGKNGCQ